VIDESHMTVPQIRGMFRGDESRKKTLIDFGFRLPSCLDNHPLKFAEVLTRLPHTVFVSATPDEWEIKRSKGKVVQQLVRPTGLVDPEVEIRSSEGQIDDLVKEIASRQRKKQRVLVTTLTKRMSEELSSYLAEKKNIKVHWLHADINTLKRTDILADLRAGKYDVIVGVNLLREGLDLPEVSLVVILDADKQGFLRSRTSLIQTMGRAARHVSAKVILYADELSTAMRESIAEVDRRRRIQLEYNRQHNITPKSIVKPIRKRLAKKVEETAGAEEIELDSLTPGEAKKLVGKLNRRMREYAKILEFEQAAKVRDQIGKIKKRFDLE
jgi:excinuclease ABC subunit B